MKKNLIYLVIATIVLGTGCRKIETDGEPIIITQPGGNGNNSGQAITLKGRINADTVLRKQNNYILQGIVYVVGNHTLTVEPGTIIKGSYSGSDVAALVITRGSKIVAQGSATDPIVFTSASANPQSGDWGGIVICGKANINTTYNGKNGLFQVEGGIDNANGDGLAGYGDLTPATPVDDDSSGVLSYVRIEYAGYAFQPDKEINSLTMAAVGSKTKIDHVQVAYAKDDAYEWFGGSVNAKYLIAWKTQDDDFDTDNGYSGKVQFGLVIRDSVIADISNSEAFESDNNSGGTSVTPKTSAVFSNITAIGPKASLNNSGSSLFRSGAHIRRNTSLSIFNTIFLGWPRGIDLDVSTGTWTAANIEDSSLRLRNITIAGTSIPTRFSFPTTMPGTIPTTTIKDDASFLTWFSNPFYNNEILSNTSDARLVQPFNYGAPDPTPFGAGSSKVLTGASFTDLKFANDNFFDKTVTFRGAIAPAGSESNWWKGWTVFK
jgi:hypothetical protein